jgi:hypothetical protein
MEPIFPDTIIIKAKYKEQYKKEIETNMLLKEAAKEYVKKHKDELPNFLTEGL